MARTGHRVICWNEKGELAIPEMEVDGWKVEVYKEMVHVEKGDFSVNIYDGCVFVGPFRIVCRGTWKRIFFYIEAKDKALLGLSKHEEYRPITEEDLMEFAHWVGMLIAGIYSPGYSSAVWLVGHYDREKIKDIIKNIKEVKKLDQGDIVFYKGGAKLYKCYWWLDPLTWLEHIIGTIDEEKEKFLDKANKLYEKVKKSNIPEDLKKEILEFIEAITLGTIFG